MTIMSFNPMKAYIKIRIDFQKSSPKVFVLFASEVWLFNPIEYPTFLKGMELI